MMAQSLTRILLERERLCSRIAVQRGDVSRYVSGLAGPAAVIDGVRGAGRYVRRHPQILVAGVAAAFILRARTMFGLTARVFAIWRLARRAHALLRFVRH
jgi:hypothetical protein